VVAKLSELIATAPKMCVTDTRQLLLHRYETDFGIYNHDISDFEKNPLALIRMHSREDSYTGSHLAERIRQYHDRHVWEVTHDPLHVFLNYPRHMVLDILELADKALRDKTAALVKEGKALEDRVAGLASQNGGMIPPPH
jgi:hypothetical protein